MKFFRWVLITRYQLLITSCLLSAIAQQTGFPAALNLARDLSLVLSTTARFFARQNLILSAHKLAQQLTVAESNFFDLLRAQQAVGTVASLFSHWHRNWEIINFFEFLFSDF